MRFKLVALDIDGTLINSQRVITPKTKDVLKKVQEMGVRVVLATGRPVAGIRKITNELELNSYALTYHGGKVIDIKTNEILFEKNLNIDDAKKIISLGEKLDTNILVWAQEHLYVNKVNEHSLRYSKNLCVEVQVFTKDFSFDNLQINKIIWYDDKDRINNYFQVLENIKFKSLNYYTSNPDFLEFVDASVSKEEGLEILRKYYHLQRNEIIAIGDGFNDLTMLKYAGVGIAMGNAPEAVKNCATFVTKTSDEDGVAYALEKYILNERSE